MPVQSSILHCHLDSSPGVLYVIPRPLHRAAYTDRCSGHSWGKGELKIVQRIRGSVIKKSDHYSIQGIIVEEKG